MSSMQDRASILVTEKIGRTQSLTPEGFLLCQDVRIARVGTMDYAPHEVPEIPPGQLGRVVLTRDENTLFDQRTIASFSGKPVTNDHPPSFVEPKTFKKYAVGVVLEPRQGLGDDAGFLVADLLIQDAQAIKDVQAGKREVSCGYDCNREMISPGLGRQLDIVGNHVALVQRGRAGPACAIQDHKGITMAKAAKTVFGRIRAAFTNQDRDALEEELDDLRETIDEDGEEEAEEKKPETTDRATLDAALTDALAKALAPLNDRMAAIETKLNDAESEEEGEKTEDEETAETMDAAAFKPLWDDTVARAEMLSPGIKIPTMDTMGAVSAVTNLQIAALEKAFGDPKRSGCVTAMLGDKPEFSKLTKDAASMAFRGASELAKAVNKAPVPTFTAPKQPSGQMTAAKLQELNKSKRA